LNRKETRFFPGSQETRMRKESQDIKNFLKFKQGSFHGKEIYVLLCYMRREKE